MSKMTQFNQQMLEIRQQERVQDQKHDSDRRADEQRHRTDEPDASERLMKELKRQQLSTRYLISDYLLL